jgi:hypothetical protein
MNITYYSDTAIKTTAIRIADNSNDLVAVTVSVVVVVVVACHICSWLIVIAIVDFAQSLSGRPIRLFVVEYP